MEPNRVQESNLRPSSDKLVRSIVESAQHISTVILTFLAVCVYVGISVAATTHEDLLLGTSLSLPLFNVQIPLENFFVLAPALLVFLHLHLLLLNYLLYCKIQRYVSDPNPPEEETDLFFASLPLSVLLGQQHPPTVRALLRTLFIAVTALLPIGLLLVTQVMFLPYHHAGITTWHKFLVLLDVGLVWYFAWRAPDLHIRTLVLTGNDNPRFIRRLPVVVLAGLCATVCVVGLSTVIAGGRAVGYEFRTGRPCPFTDFFSLDLAVRDRVLVSSGAPADALVSPRVVKGIQLAGRDLRGADFSGAVLIRADFRGADLTDAVFSKTDLRMAQFSRHQKIPRFEIPRKATLDSPVGKVTVLRGANLSEARLAGADLAWADLRSAHLEKADLHGANLSQADLRGASLHEADLRAANFSSARLVGADLWRAVLYGADLRDADLRVAKLVEAKAVAADFTSAKTLGADLRDATLYLARDLPLEGIDLRQAKLGDVSSSCGEGSSLRYPNFTDLRSVDFEPAPEEDLKAIFLSLEEVEREDVLDSDTRERFEKIRPKDLKEMKICLVVQPPQAAPPTSFVELIRGAVLLYDWPPPEPMRTWPRPERGQGDYYDRLAKELVRVRACNDPILAEALLREVSGELAPQRPLLAYSLARSFAGRSPDQNACIGIWSLSEKQKGTIARALKRDPLRTDDASGAPPVGGAAKSAGAVR